ncbi:LytR C-terminal domain-containing protein [Nocardioides ultimimeridianus]
MGSVSRSHSQRGAVLPSPVVILSIVAVALAALTFVITRGDGPKEKDITPVAASSAQTTGATSSTPTATDTSTPTATPTHKPKVIHRGQIGVVVFNDTSIRGLAGSVGAKVAQAGWHFVAADNWYGTVVSTTVYYPKGMKAAAHQLALDLGVQRVMPADISSNMSTANLTLILTGPLS